MITLLDYGAGNVRSVRNAIRKLGYSVKDAASPEDILQAEKLIFPGVGCFGSAMQRLADLGYLEPLIRYIREDRSFLGICLGCKPFLKAAKSQSVSTALVLSRESSNVLRSPPSQFPRLAGTVLSYKNRLHFSQDISKKNSILSTHTGQYPPLKIMTGY